jgi:hypothetical protein
MTAPSYTVTIHGRAKYEQFDVGDNFLYVADTGHPSNQPYELMSSAIAAAEKAVATRSFTYNQIALDFLPERITVCDQSGELLFAGLVKSSAVQWIPFLPQTN